MRECGERRNRKKKAGKRKRKGVEGVERGEEKGREKGG